MDLKEQINLHSAAINSGDCADDSHLRKSRKHLMQLQNEGETAQQHLPDRVHQAVIREHRKAVEADYSKKKSSGEFDRRAVQLQQLGDKIEQKKSEIEKLRHGQRTVDSSILNRKLLSELKDLENQKSKINEAFESERQAFESEPVNVQRPPNDEELSKLEHLKQVHDDALRYYRNNSHDSNGATRVSQSLRAVKAYAKEIGAS